MSKKRENKNIKTLDSEIQIVQIEKYINNFDNAMKKDLKGRFKKVFLILGPLMLSLIGFLIFKNSTILAIGSSITCICNIVILSKDYIKDTKKLNLKDYKSNSNVINIEQEEDIDKILQKGIGKAKGEDFYSEKYKTVLKKEESYVETEEQRKYREALEKQQQSKINKNTSNLKLVENDENYLNKEETMEQIVREIDAYSVVYKLPPLEISNSQWDLFFDTTYNFFEEKGIEKEFYNSMSQVGRFVFAKALINKKNKISIYDFVQNLYYLEYQEIEKQDLVILQQELLSKLPSSEIINYSDYIAGKSR